MSIRRRIRTRRVLRSSASAAVSVYNNVRRIFFAILAALAAASACVYAIFACDLTICTSSPRRPLVNRSRRLFGTVEYALMREVPRRASFAFVEMERFWQQ